MKRSVVLLLLILSCGKAVAEEYHVTLDPAGRFNVSWSFVDTTPTSYITFTVTCRTTGWVGLGFSPNGGMTGADIIMAWVLPNGTAQLMDMYANANGAPVKDDHQDVILVGSEENNGVITVSFKRKLNTCDKDHDNKILSSTTRLIYAYGDNDPAGEAPSSQDYHSSRGVRSVYLLEPDVELPPTPADAMTLDLTINNYNVRAEDTTYYCSFFDAPQLNEKHHMISFAPLIQEGNEGLVHHIVLYACRGLTQEHIRNNTKTEGVCSTDEMPEFQESCRDAVHAWAVGGGTLSYPEIAGYPLGGTDGSSVEYFMMEMHYDNQDLLSTWRDSSGIRIIYTPTLRDLDVGVLGLGMVYGIAVPPKPDKFRVVSYCDSTCTNQWIPESGVEVFGYMLHAHLLGVAVEVDWYRDGKQIGVFAKDDYYDFNFQELRHFKNNKKLYPGDTLKITCTYSDKNRDTMTYGGLPTSSEMCLAYIAYYPKQEVAGCGSFPGLAADMNDHVYNELSLNASSQSLYPNMEVLNEVSDWSNDAVATLQRGYEISTYYPYCFKNAMENYPGNFGPLSTTDYPYKKSVDDDKDVCYKDVAGLAVVTKPVSISVILLAACAYLNNIY